MALVMAALRVFVGLVWLANLSWKLPPSFGRHDARGLLYSFRVAEHWAVIQPLRHLVRDVVIPHFTLFGWLVVTVELPGVVGSDLVISTHGGDVILTGEKCRPQFGAPVRSHVAERAYGRFRRVIHLGVPVNTHRAEARLVDGNLRIRFPKVPNRRGEEVTIEVMTR
jgi:hypothetical protein